MKTITDEPQTWSYSDPSQADISALWYAIPEHLRTAYLDEALLTGEVPFIGGTMTVKKVGDAWYVLAWHIPRFHTIKHVEPYKL